MPTEKFDELILKCIGRVMLALLLDVVDHGGDVRFADGECAIAVLPREAVQVRKRVVNPFGRSPFDELRRLGRCHRWRCSEQQVDVIFNAADAQCLHVVVAGDSAEVGPDARLNVRRDPAFATLGAEDDVVMQSGVGVGHRAVSQTIGQRTQSEPTHKIAFGRRDILSGRAHFVAERHSMVAVGFNPRVWMPRNGFVAERRLNAGVMTRIQLRRVMAWRWFNRRSATTLVGPIIDRGLKPTATVGRSLRDQDHCVLANAATSPATRPSPGRFSS